MNKLTLVSKLNKKHKYLVAVSGGPDSMALIFELVSSNFNVVVVHVNYKKRDSAHDDQKLVTTFCKKYKIKLYTKSPSEQPRGNFQSWARTFRYNFFKKIYEKEQCNGLLVAHHQDDKIETYLLKKNRPAIYANSSLPNESLVFGMKVYRPLLNYRKDDLVNYCKINNIKFNIDETNTKSIYSRNKIRNDIILKLTEKQRQNYLRLIELEQKKIEAETKDFENKYQKIFNYNQIDIAGFNKLKQSFKIRALYKFITNLTSINPSLLSFKKLNDYVKQFSTNKPNISIKIGHWIYLTKSYNSLQITSSNTQTGFSYVITKLAPKKFKEFCLEKNGEANQGIHVLPSDFPLVVRSYQSSDRISLKNGHKFVKRLFIDKKVPQYLRMQIPLLVNAQGEILLVSKYYVNPQRKRLQSNLFVVKC
jgi:tRNA(Ile)-lysidine synthetase-like protein